MEKTVLTVFSQHQSEKIIEKSRFITYSRHVESEEEARAFIAQIRSEHSLATHVCFAFISDKTGNLQRFSDDGEPQGTAGMPILEVLKNKKLYETAVAVVRYFGGIKLGAGGLVRAYSTAAADVLTKAGTSIYVKGSKGVIDVDYDNLGLVERYLNSSGITINDKTFGNGVTIRVTTNKPWEEIETTVTDICAGGAICELEGNVWVKQSDID